MGTRDYYEVIDEESANDSQQQRLLVQQRRLSSPSSGESDSEEELYSQQEKDIANTDYSYQKKVDSDIKIRGEKRAIMIYIFFCCRALIGFALDS